VEPGYATDLLWRYNRSKIKASWLRIKEWDYYYILNDKYGITFTMSDLGFAALIAVAWLDFERGTFTQGDSIRFLTKGSMNFSPTSRQGNVEFQDKKLSLGYYIEPGMRTIRVDYPEFANSLGEKGLSGELVLQQPDMDTMVIATSWKGKPKKFYYNQKINCMPAKGTITIGEMDYQFTPDSSFGGLDWGRGNWTYKNRWYWGSASGQLNGESFGWNLGYGFSDRTAATENMVFYKGKAHKLDEVTFHMDTKNYMRPWKITSNDGRFEMDFEPIVDRFGKFNLFFIKSVQHQVFGWNTGKVVLDDGTELKIDKFLGFAEDVYNRY
jgi:hypothetical protein